jgi:pimeloyl-ACP methyl ester carboxylesterase
MATVIYSLTTGTEHAYRKDTMTDNDSSFPQQGHYINLNGLNIYYEDYGSGVPLILLHGGTSTSQTWQPFLPLFTPQFRVITPDSRAHGRTDNPSGVLSYHQMADDVAGLIQALNLEKPLVFGYSDGGQVALELGMHYPGLCTALVVGAAWYKFSDTYLDTMYLAGFESPGGVNFEHIQRDSPDWVDEMKHDHVSSPDPDYWKTLLKQISALWWTPLDYTIDDFLKISEPTLVLLGDRDGIVELQQAVEMYQLIPNAELFVIPHADHFTAKTELSMRIVEDFLLRHSSPAGQG